MPSMHSIATELVRYTNGLTTSEGLAIPRNACVVHVQGCLEIAPVKGCARLRPHNPSGPRVEEEEEKTQEF